MALLFLTLVAPTSQSADPVCQTDPSPWIQVQNVVYIRESGSATNPPYVYVESNGDDGLQYGGASPVGTHEPGGPCTGGDLLVY